MTYFFSHMGLWWGKMPCFKSQYIDMGRHIFEIKFLFLTISSFRSYEIHLLSACWGRGKCHLSSSSPWWFYARIYCGHLIIQIRIQSSQWGPGIRVDFNRSQASNPAFRWKTWPLGRWNWLQQQRQIYRYVFSHCGHDGVINEELVGWVLKFKLFNSRTSTWQFLHGLYHYSCSFFSLLNTWADIYKKKFFTKFRHTTEGGWLRYENRD